MRLAPPEVIEAEIRNGRTVILVDDADGRGGDLVCAAQMATPDTINFMAMQGRGLIRLALTRERIGDLALPFQTRRDQQDSRLPFTVSIEARTGVTTGISAADRARTIAVAIDAGRTRDDLVSPGHVFPLQVSEGGVLVRAGRPEAAVDLARLAGLNASAVLCEVLGEDGNLAQAEPLGALAERFDLKIGAVQDLIAFRLRNDTLVEEVARTPFASRWGGEWSGRVYRNKADDSEQMALVFGNVGAAETAMVRMHTLSFYTDMFGDMTERSGLVAGSMRMIAEHGAGVLVLLNRAMPGALAHMTRLRSAGSVVSPPELIALRDYGVGAMILAELGLRDIVLLTNAHLTPVGLAGYGLNIVAERRIDVAGLTA